MFQIRLEDRTFAERGVWAPALSSNHPAVVVELADSVHFAAFGNISPGPGLRKDYCLTVLDQCSSRRPRRTLLENRGH